MTPSHGEDGSRTPGRANAWDPTVTNTPSANREYDDYSFDDTTPSPNYNPGTPGGGSGTGSGYTVPHESPNTYTPQTPQSGKTTAIDLLQNLAYAHGVRGVKFNFKQRCNRI